MTQPASSTIPSAADGIPEADLPASQATADPQGDVPAVTPPTDSYVKLAMRNMVRKRGMSLVHFSLTTIGLLAFLVGISYLTR